jgi:hypothetical protein
MPLTEQDKSDLIQRVTEVIAADEPEQVIPALARYAKRQAAHSEHSEGERSRWRAFAYALDEANSQLAVITPPKPAALKESPTGAGEDKPSP